MTGTAWVVAANGTKAQLYEWPGLAEPLGEIECVLNPENRMHDREIATGSVGQSIAGRAALAPRILPKEHTRDEFARRVAGKLIDARKHNRFSELVVVSSNPFLGELLAHLDAETRDMLAVSYPIDVTALPRRELENWLRRRRKPGLAD
jgi:protein required for attachment to host cells